MIQVTTRTGMVYQKGRNDLHQKGRNDLPQGQEWFTRTAMVYQKGRIDLPPGEEWFTGRAGMI